MQAVAYPYPVQYTSLQPNIQLAYMDIGSGEETYLFIHGLANYAPVWKYQLQHLNEQVRCIAVDLPGNGLSPTGDYPYGVFFYAETIKLFCEKLQLSNITLVGHSMGGQISMILALRYPWLFQKIRLIAPAGIELYSDLDKIILNNLLTLGDFLYSDVFHLQQAIKESFFQKHPDQQIIIDELTQLMHHQNNHEWRKMAKSCIQSMLNQPVHAFLPQLEIPVQIIFGKNDHLIPNKLIHPTLTLDKLLDYAQTMIPQLSTHIVDSAGHFVQIEKFSEVNQLLRQY